MSCILEAGSHFCECSYICKPEAACSSLSRHHFRSWLLDGSCFCSANCVKLALETVSLKMPAAHTHTHRHRHRYRRTHTLAGERKRIRAMHVVHKIHKMAERLMAKVGGHKLQELERKTGESEGEGGGGVEGRSLESPSSRPSEEGVITFVESRVKSRIKCIFKYRPT